MKVTGEAWMDHQWGDFATYQEGGWDWFAVQLDDGTDVMLYLIRDADGEYASRRWLDRRPRRGARPCSATAISR